MSDEFRREYVVRLPMPLAQLYSRAHNAKDARSRHDNAFYCFEALIKLASATAIAAYVQQIGNGAAHVDSIDRLLERLAAPSLGHWLEMLRELTRHFSASSESVTHPLGQLWVRLSQTRSDLPGLLGLFRRIKNGPDGPPADASACSVLDVLQVLVGYRNAVIGHGSPRFEDFYGREMGPLLIAALNDALANDVVDPLGMPESRLVYLTGLRTETDGHVALDMRDLTGIEAGRMPPVRLSPDAAGELLPNRVAVLWPGQSVPLQLDPLLVYREREFGDEVFFLNRGRGRRDVEYLSYSTGRTERDREMVPALAAFLSRIAERS